MTTLTLDQVEQIAAQRYAEANAPSAAAVRAIETLRSALDHCTAAERADVVQLLRDEIPAATTSGFIA